jgi:hypothetical protein
MRSLNAPGGIEGWDHDGDERSRLRSIRFCEGLTSSGIDHGKTLLTRIGLAAMSRGVHAAQSTLPYNSIVVNVTANRAQSRQLCCLLGHILSRAHGVI